MSEEEKKAIELLKEIADVRSCVIGDDLYEEDALILLNLIEKQQKEIESLKNDNIKLSEEEQYKNVEDGLRLTNEIINCGIRVLEELLKENTDEALTEWVNGERINDIKHISKDTIRKITKKYGYGDFAMQKIIELLEEN